MMCAIHQPNFFPWLGYFDKIRRADVFVFLDAVAYGKSGSGMGSWTNRVPIDVGGRAVWFGCPVRRRPGMQAVCDVEIDDSQPWRGRLLRTLEVNYKRAPGFTQTIELLRPLLDYPSGRLAEFNEHAVRRLAAALGLECRFVRQSELAVTGKGTRRLIAIANAVGADAYLCGGGAAGYQEDALFAASGIDLVYQNFTARPYRDPGSFVPGLSVIDYLMWAADAWARPSPAFAD
jgi:WbqC-like protein family